MLPTTATERLLLRVLDKTYARPVLEYYKRNRDFLSEWEPQREPDFYTLGYHQEQLSANWDAMEQGSALCLWIFRQKASDQPIGYLNFSQIIRGSFLSCMLAYKLDKSYINQGFMTEAVKKGVKIMFEDFQLHRIEANIMPKNERSIRVIEKLGFYNEGLATQYLKIQGNWEDHIHFVLLNPNV